MPIKNITLTSPFDGHGSPFHFGGAAQNVLALNPNGDSYVIDTSGGDDTINVLDTGTVGSDDVLIGGKGSDYIIGGLGDDQIFGGEDSGKDGGKGQADATNTLFGDAQGNFADFTGGNDTIHGGNDSTNVMYGDVLSANSSDGVYSFQGGDDVLIGGDNAVSAAIGGTSFTAGNFMVGDGYRSTDASDLTGGNDTLVSGQNSDDVMIGDFGFDTTGTGAVGGEDTFVFGPSNGDDTIVDFRSTDTDGDDTNGVGDKVDLTAFGPDLGFGDLNFSIDGTDQVLAFDADNSVTFLDLAGYTFVADDFIFAA
jgi:hypothetical protein